jgi:dTDP-4-dehydrorhamnose reductase
MRVLITGAEGQIGRALVAAAPDMGEILATDRSSLDITSQTEVVRRLRDFRPDLILNAAGYTAVDQAEKEPEIARAVNQEGARNVALASAEIGARLLHFSTDYVFDGWKSRPYTPEDFPDPINAYGASKLAGERAVSALLGQRAAIIRTAWVYAANGHNFLRTMLRLLNERDEVTVVADQTGTPTSASSVARATWSIAMRGDLSGILHWTDDGVATWYEFAEAIRREALAAGRLGRAARILPVTSEEYAAPASRPRYSVLDCSATRRSLGLIPEHWQAALRHTLQELDDA